MLAQMMTDPVTLLYIQDGKEYVRRLCTFDYFVCVCIAAFRSSRAHCLFWSPPIVHFSRRRTYCYSLQLQAHAVTLFCCAVRVERDSTVAGAAAELVAALQLIMKMPVEECGPTNRYIYFVIRNLEVMHENFHHALVSILLRKVSYRAHAPSCHTQHSESIGWILSALCSVPGLLLLERTHSSCMT